MSDKPRPRGVKLITPEHTFVDRGINNVIKSYEATLENGELADFRDKADVGEEVDHICFTWALRGMNDRMWDKAVDLRSMHATKKLDTFTHTARANNKSYIMGGHDNPFWYKVDKTTEFFLGKLALDEHGIKIDAIDREAEAQRSIANETTTLFILNEHAIKRNVVGDIVGRIAMVTYSAVAV